MAEELLLQKSLQREKDEISRLQCQLQQQVSSSRSSSSSRQTPQSNMTTATMASPNLKLGQQPNQWDLAEQQRRLLDLQSQQKHFQQVGDAIKIIFKWELLIQQKHQQPTKHQQQPHFQLPTGQILHPADLGTAGHGIAALLSSPAMTTAAAAALAQLLSHRQQQQQALIINEAASFPKMPSPSHVPNSLASQSQLLTASHLDWRFLFSPMGTAAAHNIYNTGAKLPSDSPCPTPAYHYQLAAPKPSNRPLPIFQQQNFGITGNLSRTTVKPQAQTTQVGVDVRPADSTISTTTASAMALNDVTAGSIRKINRTDQSWEKNGHRETDKNIRNNEVGQFRTKFLQPPIIHFTNKISHFLTILILLIFFSQSLRHQSRANARSSKTITTTPPAVTAPKAAKAARGANKSEPCLFSRSLLSNYICCCSHSSAANKTSRAPKLMRWTASSNRVLAILWRLLQRPAAPPPSKT
jgi:hypothetical protein